MIVTADPIGVEVDADLEMPPRNSQNAPPTALAAAPGSPPAAKATPVFVEVDLRDLEVTEGDSFENAALLKNLRPKALSSDAEVNTSLMPLWVTRCDDCVKRKLCPNSCLRDIVWFSIKAYVIGLIEILLMLYSQHQGELYTHSPTAWAAWGLIPFVVGVELVGVMSFLANFAGPRLASMEPARLVFGNASSGSDTGMTPGSMRLGLVAIYYVVYYFTFLFFYSFTSWTNDIKSTADTKELPYLDIIWWYCGPQFFMSLFIYGGGFVFFMVIYVMYLECIKWHEDAAEQAAADARARARRQPPNQAALVAARAAAREAMAIAAAARQAAAAAAAAAAVAIPAVVVDNHNHNNNDDVQPAVGAAPASPSSRTRSHSRRSPNGSVSHPSSRSPSHPSSRSPSHPSSRSPSGGATNGSRGAGSRSTASSNPSDARLFRPREHSASLHSPAFAAAGPPAAAPFGGEIPRQQSQSVRALPFANNNNNNNMHA